MQVRCSLFADYVGVPNSVTANGNACIYDMDVCCNYLMFSVVGPRYDGYVRYVIDSFTKPGAPTLAVMPHGQVLSKPH